MFPKLKSLPKFAWSMAALLVVAVLLRCWRISDNQFLFYDEGMYLGYNRGFLDMVAANPPHNITEFFIIMGLMFKAALTTAKSLWFFILNLRVFNWGVEAWYFARLVSAVAGIATVLLIYFWAKRSFNSSRIAAFSAVFLAFLPSHVFYSRLGMQEALSAFLFLSAVYLYSTHRAIGWRLFVSAFILSCVFFTNYRMIIAPALIAFIEIFQGLASKQKINWVKLSLHTSVFYAVVFIVGSLDGGVNREVTFGWMFHQAKDATGKFDVVNFLSYPYYTFALEGIFAGILFWMNLRSVLHRQWSKLLPFGIVLVQMGLFSFAAEKGARYLCVVLPFMAVAIAVAVDDLLTRANHARLKMIVKGLLVLSMVGMCYQSFQLATATTAYEQSMAFILERSPEAVIVSTQPLVEELYAYHEGQLLPCPKDLGSLIEMYKKGARYLVLDPQAYISWTADEARFSPPLIPFLQEIVNKVEPMAQFDHLNNAFLKRFVLDHNEHLRNSLVFLGWENPLKGSIRIYDLTEALLALRPK